MIEIQMLRRLMIWVVPYWTMFAFAIISLITIAVTTSLLPLFIKPLLDNILTSQHGLEEFQFALLAILGLLITRSLASFSCSYATSWVSGKVGIDLRRTLFDKLLALPLSYPKETNSDKLNINLFSEIEHATDSIAQILIIFVKEILTITGLLIVMILLNWEFSFMGFLIAVVIGLIMQFVSQASNSHQKVPSLLITPTFLTSCKHIKSIKLDGSQSQESQHFCNSIDHQRNLALKQVVAKTFSKTIAFIMIATILTVFFFLFKQQISLGMMTVGDASALITAVLMLVLPVRRVLNIQTSPQNKFQVIHNVDALLAQQNETDPGKVEIANARGQIRFEEVNAGNYSQTCPPLFNLTLTIQPGEIIALPGSSQGQERTLIDLIARFIHPASGRILLNDVDIATIKLTDLRAKIAWITPDTRLLNDTIAANIAYGTMRCATEASIMKVARTCHVTTFAREMPHGLQTRIDNQDIKFTENQRQRILIARALLKNPAIVIIDETTSVFDTDCRLVNNALDALIQNRTTLIASSQPNMLGKAHRIIKLT
ncbi:ABC transporter transmembrane domain-containing protein [Nitrosomonas communis]|uniref:ATP-binding cassette, subfamily B, MsbA n=1 Tax=Nitrosomonas communis TaxID=44574 RepID=A0A1H2YVF3_9PROT|nr:ABC transporter transmembrane domain-containing protein [Nitrosomonas communis]SDX08728.1 ATP-binding cassette, subfamily B, MsbA [Nitrosomonas communis]